MTARPFTPAERADIADVCEAFAKEHRVHVAHNFNRPDSVFLSISDGNRSVASSRYTAEIDRAATFADARFAVTLTLGRMWKQ